MNRRAFTDTLLNCYTTTEVLADGSHKITKFIEAVDVVGIEVNFRTLYEYVVENNSVYDGKIDKISYAQK